MPKKYNLKYKSILPKILQTVVLSAISVIRPSSNQAPKISELALPISEGPIRMEDRTSSEAQQAHDDPNIPAPTIAKSYTMTSSILQKYLESVNQGKGSFVNVIHHTFSDNKVQ